MITEEQIKNLTPGDPLVIYTTFDHIDDDGDLWFSCPQKFDSESFEYIDPEYVSLPGEPVEQPKPKYDPCREFKEGDEVRVVSCKGRNGLQGVPDGTLATVTGDEQPYLCVEIEIIEDTKKTLYYIDPAYLELVTPVEEIKQYSVHETDYLYRVMQSVDGGEQVVCEYRKNTHPHAKERAEAERDSLNAEYRKEQK